LPATLKITQTDLRLYKQPGACQEVYLCSGVASVEHYTRSHLKKNGGGSEIEYKSKASRPEGRRKRLL